MREAIDVTLELARTTGGYGAFRTAMYERPLREIVADPRETVPVALALVLLAAGDPTQGIVMAANFGRDADTIATMVGSVCGALRGADALQRQWVEKAEAGAGAAYERLTDHLVDLLIRRRDEAHATAAQLDWLLETEEASIKGPSPC
jgi:hypothetical protein